MAISHLIPWHSTKKEKGGGPALWLFNALLKIRKRKSSVLDCVATPAPH
jgi:hypothetical protein